MSKNNDSLTDIWKLKQRGKRDSERHKELIEKAIRKNGKDLITTYDLIKSDGSKKVKIPIRFLNQYKFKYGKLNKDENPGQGLNGKVGDKYKIKKGKGDKPGEGKPGDEEGEKVFDAEITVDELVDILLDELNLPWMDPKNQTQIEIEKEEFKSISKKGLRPHLDLKKTLYENIKRNAAKGNPTVGGFANDDLRYRTWETTVEYESNAAVYLLLDRSGSMSKSKTDIAKTFYFWMVQFLKRRYKKVDLVFIAHDVRAFVVDEKEFFSIMSGGGTKCSSAFKLALEHIKVNHPADSWNNYVFEMSDGDNYPDDNRLCIEYVRELLPLTKAIGYGEITNSTGMNAWLKEEDRLHSMLNKQVKRTRFLSMQFKSKDDVFDGLKRFFNVKGSTKVK